MSDDYDYDRLRVYRAVADLMQHCGMSYDQAQVWISIYDEKKTERDQFKLELDLQEQEDRAHWNRLRTRLAEQEPADSE